MATRWVASYVPETSAEAEPDQEVYFTMRYDGRIEEFGSCNTFNGHYMVPGETVKIGPLISTRMFCPAIAVEDNLFRILGSSNEFLIVEDQLYLSPWLLEVPSFLQLRLGFLPFGITTFPMPPPLPGLSSSH